METETIVDQLEEVMGQMPYGLYIIGSTSGSDANGMMADWVMQVSFSPRLIALSLEEDAHTLVNLRSTGNFTINFLAQDAEGMRLAAMFAQPYEGAKVKGRAGAAAKSIHHKLEGVPHQRTARGSPILDKAMAWLECRAAKFVPAGDHTLVLADVIDGALVRTGEPLTSTYTGWTYSG